MYLNVLGALVPAGLDASVLENMKLVREMEDGVNSY
jgi:hypothetical protein